MSLVPFELRVGSPVRTQDHYEDLDVDPLGELTGLERGLTRFCVDHNREVAIRVGSHEHRVWLFPDLVSQLRRTPELLAALDRDERVQLGFPDHGVDIDCQPRGEIIECTVVRYGASKTSAVYECKRTEVMDALRGLANVIVRDAVSSGYVERVDADAYS